MYIPVAGEVAVIATGCPCCCTTVVLELLDAGCWHGPTTRLSVDGGTGGEHMGTAAADAQMPAHGKGWHTAPGCTCVVLELLDDAVVLELLDDARLPALGT